jgi:hypothetical protein
VQTSSLETENHWYPMLPRRGWVGLSWVSITTNKLTEPTASWSNPIRGFRSLDLVRGFETLQS